MRAGKSEAEDFMSTVDRLLTDFHCFARLCNRVRLEKYKFEVIDSFCYPVLVFYISIDKALVESPEEAECWMKHNHFPDTEIELFRNENSSAHVMEVSPVYAGAYCFGENDRSFFIAEFGCGYD